MRTGLLLRPLCLHIFFLLQQSPASFVPSRNWPEPRCHQKKQHPAQHHRYHQHQPLNPHLSLPHSSHRPYQQQTQEIHHQPPRPPSLQLRQNLRRINRKDFLPESRLALGSALEWGDLASSLQALRRGCFFATGKRTRARSTRLPCMRKRRTIQFMRYIRHQFTKRAIQEQYMNFRHNRHESMIPILLV